MDSPGPAPDRDLPLSWLVALGLAAVVAHLPALAGYFAQDDWGFLAKAAGSLPVGSFPARPLSNIVYWKLGYAFFGLSAPGYHVVALLAWATCVVLIARIARRLGLSLETSMLAGLVGASTPVVVTPVFWVSASAEILAVLFALAAIDRWLAGGRLSLIATVAFAWASFFSKEPALLALPFALLVLWRGRPAEVRRDRSLAGVIASQALVAIGSVLAGIRIYLALRPDPGTPYEMAGALVTALNFGVLGGWLLSPWDFAPVGTPLLPWIGFVFWASWALIAAAAWRGGRRLPAVALAFAVLSTLPVVRLERHLRPYYLLLATPAWAWTVAAVLPLWWKGLERDWSPAQRRLALLALGLALSAFSFAATRDRLTRRTFTGELADLTAARSAIAHQVRGQVDALPLLTGETLAVLNASVYAVPEDMDPQEARQWTSKVHAAVDGTIGLSMMVPEGVIVVWDSHLDALRRDSLVFLDAGGPQLRFLGRADNARLYSALIAVAAGQYERAQHDLWVVSGNDRTMSRFVFDEDALPIPAEHIDEMSPAFAAHLLQEGSIASRRVLLLYQQLYEAVRGKPLRLSSEDTGR